MITPLEIDQALSLSYPLFVDVRSEREFKVDHIPGAINVPLFNDEERALVGTVYKTQSPEQARYLGLKIVSPKLPDLVQLIQSQGEGREIVLYCWRGGMRSLSLATVLDLMNIHVYRLCGGYKSFRRWICSYFSQDSFPFQVVVVHGLTGTGKTNVLKKLAERGVPVLDLEGLAGHRGSVFGSVGLSDQPTQKYFESLIWNQCDKFKNLGYLVVECESKRIGRLVLPLLLINGMKAGRHILLYDTLDNRVKRIFEEYDVNKNREELAKILGNLKNRLGLKRINEWQSLIMEGKSYPVLEKLLVDYYDVFYKYTDHPSAEFELSVNSADEDLAANEIADFLTK
ncbi:MAG: tRNA 2-selenouridine(34) synthase MnmH [Desulfitobacteriaceae bacterium]|nr:tRNA 2-selenouridine(34) synthase MnmH [Desulfitobacteriaceae bacterium]